MTNPVLDNSVEDKAVVLWQYDHAPNLIGLVDGLDGIAAEVVTQFWDYFRDCVLNIDTADEFGLSVLGRLIGLPWPSVTAGTSPSRISAEFYRRLLKGRFFLYGMDPTVANYNHYLNIIWAGNRAHVVDGQNMSMSFTAPSNATPEETALHTSSPDLIYFYPAGIRYAGAGPQGSGVVGYAGQVLKKLSEDYALAGDDARPGGVFAGNSEARYPANATGGQN